MARGDPGGSGEDAGLRAAAGFFLSAAHFEPKFVGDSIAGFGRDGRVLGSGPPGGGDPGIRGLMVFLGGEARRTPGESCATA